MKPGDLVKRCDTFKEWLKHNSWMSLEEEQEVGILIQIGKPSSMAPNRYTHVVSWPVTGISWEIPSELEIVHLTPKNTKIRDQ